MTRPCDALRHVTREVDAGVGMLTAGASVPVVPCYLKGTFRAFPPRRVVPRFTKISLWIGEPMSFESVENNRAGWNAIAAATEAAVKKLAEKARRGK